MILRQVLQLNEPSGPATGTVGSVKLKHSTGAAISADSVYHGLILFDAGFGKLLPEHKNALQFRRRCLNKLCHGLFAEAVGLQSVIRKPLLHLLHAVGIIKLGQFTHGIRQLCAGAGIHINSLSDKRQVNRHTAIIDFLIDVVFLPDRIRHREFLQALLNGHLSLDVTDVIALKSGPFLRRVVWIVSGALTVCLCRSTGLAEELDQILALGELLFLQTEDRADAFEGER